MAAAEAEYDVDDEAAAMNDMGFVYFCSRRAAATTVFSPSSWRPRAGPRASVRDELAVGSWLVGHLLAREPPQLLPINTALGRSARFAGGHALGGTTMAFSTFVDAETLRRRLAWFLEGRTLRPPRPMRPCLAIVYVRLLLQRSAACQGLLRVFEEAGRQRTAICTNLRDPEVVPLIALTARALQKLLLAFC